MNLIIWFLFSFLVLIFCLRCFNLWTLNTKTPLPLMRCSLMTLGNVNFYLPFYDHKAFVIFVQWKFVVCILVSTSIISLWTKWTSIIFKALSFFHIVYVCNMYQMGNKCFWNHVHFHWSFATWLFFGLIIANHVKNHVKTSRLTK